jgi:hypothetical protein
MGMVQCFLKVYGLRRAWKISCLIFRPEILPIDWYRGISIPWNHQLVNTYHVVSLWHETYLFVVLLHAPTFEQEVSSISTTMAGS